MVKKNFTASNQAKNTLKEVDLSFTEQNPTQHAECSDTNKQRLVFWNVCGICFQAERIIVQEYVTKQKFSSYRKCYRLYCTQVPIHGHN